MCASFGSAGHFNSEGCPTGALAQADLNEIRIHPAKRDGRASLYGDYGRLKARLSMHNSGAVTHTSKYRPWRIKTYVAFIDEDRALAFEKYLKSGSGRAFAKARL